MARVKASAQATIAAGSSLSGAANLGAKILCAIIVPATWAAAGIAFQVSDDLGVTWFPLYDSTGAEVTISSANAPAGRRVTVNSLAFAGVDYIKVQSGSNAAPVVQAGQQVLTLVARKQYGID